MSESLRRRRLFLQVPSETKKFVHKYEEVAAGVLGCFLSAATSRLNLPAFVVSAVSIASTFFMLSAILRVCACAGSSRRAEKFRRCLRCGVLVPRS